MRHFCAWCMKAIKQDDKTTLKNGHLVHAHCFDENIEANNQMMREMIENNRKIARQSEDYER